MVYVLYPLNLHTVGKLRSEVRYVAPDKISSGGTLFEAVLLYQRLTVLFVWYFFV